MKRVLIAALAAVLTVSAFTGAAVLTGRFKNSVVPVAHAIPMSTTISLPSASAKLDYSNRAFIYDFGPLTVNVFLFIGLVALILSYIVLYKTRLGLRLRACGEHPQAADSVGINVYKMRYIGVLISGVLGGIGGMAYIIPSVSSWNFEVGVSGAGFLALAVMIFGQWKPFRIFFAAVFFALFKSLANIASSIPFLAELGWTQNMYNMIPFIASMIILAFTSKKSRAPKAEGIPYDKGSR